MLTVVPRGAATERIRTTRLRAQSPRKIPPDTRRMNFTGLQTRRTIHSFGPSERNWLNTLSNTTLSR